MSSKHWACIGTVRQWLRFGGRLVLTGNGVQRQPRTLRSRGCFALQRSASSPAEEVLGHLPFAGVVALQRHSPRGEARRSGLLRACWGSVVARRRRSLPRHSRARSRRGSRSRCRRAPRPRDTSRASCRPPQCLPRSPRGISRKFSLQGEDERALQEDGQCAHVGRTAPRELGSSTGHAMPPWAQKRENASRNAATDSKIVRPGHEMPLPA